jgi:CRP-like cAMP-binding protein
MSSELDILRETELFRGLPEQVLEHFASLGERRSYRAGDVVFVEMSEGEEIFLVLQGTASVQLALANKDTPYDIVELGPSETFGEVSFVERGQRSATVIAETDLDVLVWSCDSWHAECEKDPRVGYHLVLGIARVMARSLRRWNVKVLNESHWGFA